MIKINYMSTLFVGIDVSSKSNAVYAMDFDENKLITSSFRNNQPGADELAQMISACMIQHPNLDTIVIALESTSVYSIHIANFLSASEVLMPYKPYVYCVNPKATANYRKSYISMDKTDPVDAFLIADFARVGRTKKYEPWRGSKKTTSSLPQWSPVLISYLTGSWAFAAVALRGGTGNSGRRRFDSLPLYRTVSRGCCRRQKWLAAGQAVMRPALFELALDGVCGVGWIPV